MTTMCIKGRSTGTIAAKGDIKDQFHILEVLWFTILSRFQACTFSGCWVQQWDMDFQETLGVIKKIISFPFWGDVLSGLMNVA